MAYTKLFSSIVTSTIWSESDRTRIVWITMLAICDKNGEVQGSIPGLARIAGVPVEDCRAAIATFLAPDPDSRTKDDEGRRLEEIDGGWLLLNYGKYREMASGEDRLRSAAQRQARARERKKRNSQSHAESRTSHAPVTPESLQNCQAEAEAEAENTNTSPSADRFKIPSEEELRLHASEIGLPIPEMLKFQAFYESNGWMVGKRKMKSWVGAMAGWKIRWEESRGVKVTSEPKKPFVPQPHRGIFTQEDLDMLNAAL